MLICLNAEGVHGKRKFENFCSDAFAHVAQSTLAWLLACSCTSWGKCFCLNRAGYFTHTICCHTVGNFKTVWANLPIPKNWMTYADCEKTEWQSAWKSSYCTNELQMSTVSVFAIKLKTICPNLAGLTEQGVQSQWKFSSRSEQNQRIATWFELLNVGEKQHFLLKV